MKEKLLEALPLFIGAILGVWMFYSVLNFFGVIFISVVLIIVGTFGKKAGQRLMMKRPVAAVYVWQFSVMVPLGLIAFGGYTATFVVENMQHWMRLIPYLDLADVSDKKIEAISGTLSTAVTTFLGAMFLDDHKKTDGGFWPPAQIKKTMKDTFGPEVDELKKRFAKESGESQEAFKLRMASAIKDLETYELASRAVYSQEISIEHPDGWSLSGALARADIVKKTFLSPVAQTEVKQS